MIKLLTRVSSIFLIASSVSYSMEKTDMDSLEKNLTNLQQGALGDETVAPSAVIPQEFSVPSTGPKRVYNLKRDPNPGPILFKMTSLGNQKPLPESVDLRASFPAVYDQGKIGSCTGNAAGAAMAYQFKKRGITLDPSRLFLYYNARMIGGFGSQEDSGATIGDIVRSGGRFGASEETFHPYSDDSVTFTKKPNLQAYHNAMNYFILDNFNSSRLHQDGYTLKSHLAQGIPIVFGLSIYSSFESAQVAQTGKVPLPDASKENFFGGHALLLVGYNNQEKSFLIRNSWGDKWGQKGYAFVPENYILDQSLAHEFYKIDLVGKKPTSIPMLKEISPFPMVQTEDGISMNPTKGEEEAELLVTPVPAVDKPGEEIQKQI